MGPQQGDREEPLRDLTGDHTSAVPNQTSALASRACARASRGGNPEGGALTAGTRGWASTGQQGGAPQRPHGGSQERGPDSKFCSRFPSLQKGLKKRKPRGGRPNGRDPRWGLNRATGRSPSEASRGITRARQLGSRSASSTTSPIGQRDNPRGEMRNRLAGP